MTSSVAAAETLGLARRLTSRAGRLGFFVAFVFYMNPVGRLGELGELGEVGIGPKRRAAIIDCTLLVMFNIWILTF